MKMSKRIGCQPNILPGIFVLPSVKIAMCSGDATARVEVLIKQKAEADNQVQELLHDKRQLEAQAVRVKVCVQASVSHTLQMRLKEHVSRYV